MQQRAVGKSRRAIGGEHCGIDYGLTGPSAGSSG
jgi:hypothetical protein